jgi:hypothetical protein
METIATLPKESSVFDAYSGVNLAETTRTIQINLNKHELLRYAKAMVKIEVLQNLNLKDLHLLDKIDALTYKHHGMCLKDSLVTKARLKACAKYKVEFIDRDGLVDHMNCMLPSEYSRNKGSNFKRELAEFFIKRLGKDSPGKLRNILIKLDSVEDLDLADLKFLSDMEVVASQELDWTIINPELIEAINRSCKKLGIYFQNLQQVATN